MAVMTMHKISSLRANLPTNILRQVEVVLYTVSTSDSRSLSLEIMGIKFTLFT